MRKHFTLDSLTSAASSKKTAASERKAFSEKRVEKNDVSPRESVIRNILNYSLALKVMHTKEAGCAMMVMN